MMQRFERRRDRRERLPTPLVDWACPKSPAMSPHACAPAAELVNTNSSGVVGIAAGVVPVQAL
jgi:hypothetical protein